jgi:hypothetical protein
MPFPCDPRVTRTIDCLGLRQGAASISVGDHARIREEQQLTQARTTHLLGTIRACAGGLYADARFLRATREPAALPLLLVVAVGQSCSPTVADIIGARRACRAVMISSGSIACR